MNVCTSHFSPNVLSEKKLLIQKKVKTKLKSGKGYLHKGGFALLWKNIFTPLFDLTNAAHPAPNDQLSPHHTPPTSSHFTC